MRKSVRVALEQPKKLRIGIKPMKVESWKSLSLAKKRKQDLEYKKDLTILTKITRIMNS
jgi:hypothetical protein